ncbi:phenylalanine--tRNA ligase subunit beta [Patescibacteria group bacterium]|nr:phenylalanine--tRNA ligase subunit beta [Patescibacteria group bacterium]
MKVSLTWLQTYFDAPLPDAGAVADAFTFHAFEIEEANGDLLDVKVLPNRAADCLSHFGLAKELSAILTIPLKADPLRAPLPKKDIASPFLTVMIEDPKKCSRYMGAVVRGVKVGPSPAWLREALEAVGQRSINNIVDATNYVMLNIGQPLHAFDAAKLAQKNGAYAIGVRSAKEGEKMTTLSGEEYSLSPSIQLIADANADTPIALAGIKGGMSAEVTAGTTDLIIESANFDGTVTRRGAQALKLFTDASMRFQNRSSPELCAYGMRDVLALITDIAGGEVTGVVDEYPVRSAPNKEVSVSLAKINGILGSDFSKEDVEDVFKRLALPYRVANDVFTVTPPFERTDLVIPEDLVEEVGRIIGYDKISAVELPPIVGAPDQAKFRGKEKLKDALVEEGFIEISTQSFAEKGDIYLANPLDKEKPALRTSLDENMAEAFSKAKQYAPLVLSPNQKLKLFEIGTVFPREGEMTAIKTSEPTKDVSPIFTEEAEYAPKQYELGTYKPFSVYPFVVRDIALWVPHGTEAAAIENAIRTHAGELLVRLDQFDTFEKERRVSYAFRLVFQSEERTLTDEEVSGIMEKISAALRAAGYEVR